jgi:uncharacterized DUF497 family protein
MSVRWTLDPAAKERANRAKHGISFGLAARVLNDPAQVSRLDTSAPEERWQTIGKPSAGYAIYILVVHTEPVARSDGIEEGRIISARRATRREQRQYEEGEY